MHDLAVIVPSRGRPGNIAMLRQAFVDTRATAHLVVAVDDDDALLPRYRALELEHLIVGPRLRLAGTLNVVARGLLGQYRTFGVMGDDHRPRSRGWDARFVAGLDALGTGIVYGDDLAQGAALPTAVAMSADIVAALDGVTPPGMIHLYIDNFWHRLGTDLGRLRYFPDVVIEHLHPLVGKAAVDPLYREVNAPSLYAADEATFNAYIASDAYRALLKQLEPST